MRALVLAFVFHVMAIPLASSSEPPLAIVSQIATGGNFNCAILQTGPLKCWGQNTSGQLGLGDVVNRGTQAAQMELFGPVQQEL